MKAPTANEENFSWGRFWAVLIKEFIQMRRDRLTFAMMIGMPVMQLILFGYAIDTDPKNLPAAVVVGDHSPFSRSLIEGMKNSGYFKMIRAVEKRTEVEHLLTRGIAQFVVEIPEAFARNLVRGMRPTILVEVDATDPAATSNAVAAIKELSYSVLNHELTGGFKVLRSKPPPFELRVHARYNPEGLSRYNIVPGLIGVILTMSMMLLTALAMTRERERGTVEHLLATPARPVEVMVGKILPFVLVGFVQVVIVLLAARFLFEVPLAGGLVLLSIILIIFITINLSIGFTFSTLARNQLQAMQMSFFFFLPSLMLSGFMFPFRSMPLWAQYLGEVFPLTHFLRIVRGILLKGNGFVEIWPEVWPLLFFWFFVVALALKRYQETLD